MSTERVRLRRAEQQALVDMFAITDRAAILLEREGLDKRLKSIPRGMYRLKTAKTHLKKLSQALLDTVPADQLIHMQRNLKRTKFHIYTGPLLGDKDSMEGRFLSINELNTVASAIAEICRFCPHDDAQKQRSCEFRKLMDKMPADTICEECGDRCGWYLTFARAGEDE